MKPNVSRQHGFSLLIVVILFLSIGPIARGQTWTQYDQGTPPQHAAGVSPVGSYVSADLGTVNLGNGALNIALPMGTVGGRGFSIPLSLNYSSKVWSAAHDTTYDPLQEAKTGNGDVTVAYATYGEADSYTDIYNRIAVGW